MTESKEFTAADRVIAAFGSQAELARDLGVSYQRVFGWKKSGRIPSKMQKKILAAAAANKIKLKPADLVNA